MKYNSVLDAFKEGEIVIPLYMYKLFPSLKINLDSFVFLMYLRSKGNMIVFNPKIFGSDLGLDNKNIMNYINELQMASLIDIKVVKNDKGIMEEYISLDGFYEKLGLNIVSKANDEISKSKDDTEDIFALLEREIGKQLSPMEIEIVKAWKETGYSDELIKEAIKEAVFSNVPSLRYIDKILYTWNKEGITSKDDVIKSKKNFRDKQKETKKENIEIYDNDDWLASEDE
jgi:DNA replication protein